MASHEHDSALDLSAKCVTPLAMGAVIPTAGAVVTAATANAAAVGSAFTILTTGGGTGVVATALGPAAMTHLATTALGTAAVAVATPVVVATGVIVGIGAVIYGLGRLLK